MRIEQSTPLFKPEKVALDKLIVAVGHIYVIFHIARGPKGSNARLDTFIQYGTTPVGHVQDKMTSAVPTRFVYVKTKRLSLALLNWTLDLTPGKRKKISSSRFAR